MGFVKALNTSERVMKKTIGFRTAAMSRGSIKEPGWLLTKMVRPKKWGLFFETTILRK
jgi:hypothetical protein